MYTQSKTFLPGKHGVPFAAILNHWIPQRKIGQAFAFAPEWVVMGLLLEYWTPEKRWFQKFRA